MTARVLMLLITSRQPLWAPGRSAIDGKLVSALLRCFNPPGGAHLEQDSYTQQTKPLETKQDAEESEEGSEEREG